MAHTTQNEVRVPIKVRIEVEVTVAVDKDGAYHPCRNGVVTIPQITEALTKVDKQRDFWEKETGPREGYLRSYVYIEWSGLHRVFYTRVVNVTPKWLTTDDRTFDKDSLSLPFDPVDVARETSPEAIKKWRAINKANKLTKALA